MTGETFAARVATLHQSWLDRRSLQNAAGAHDFQSNLALLRTLYRWSAECVDDINNVYGAALDAAISAPPDDTGPAFTVTVASGFLLTFAITARRRSDPPAWAVSATIQEGRKSAPLATSPDRRTGYWTRAHLDNSVLSLLSSYERARADLDLDLRSESPGEPGSGAQLRYTAR